jgi:hypothetical protein
MEILLLILLTGVFYMIAPVIYVKRRGKVTRGKALLLSLVNWLTIQFLFLIIYVLIFPGEIDSYVYSGPALWLFVAWKYMTVENGTKKAKSHRTIPTDRVYLVGHSLDDLERKFRLNLDDIPRETLTRGTTQYALFNFTLGKTPPKSDKFQYLVVAYEPTNGFRYFALESSFTGASMLCEWLFDHDDNETGHLNYGSLALDEYFARLHKATKNSVETVLIDHIHAMITMNIEPEFTSVKNESGWVGTAKG